MEGREKKGVRCCRKEGRKYVGGIDHMAEKKVVLVSQNRQR